MSLIAGFAWFLSMSAIQGNKSGLRVVLSVDWTVFKNGQSTASRRNNIICEIDDRKQTRLGFFSVSHREGNRVEVPS